MTDYYYYICAQTGDLTPEQELVFQEDPIPPWWDCGYTGPIHDTYDAANADGEAHNGANSGHRGFVFNSNPGAIHDYLLPAEGYPPPSQG